MAQRDTWEHEYRTRALVTGGTEATQEVKNFFRYLRRTHSVLFEKIRVLDLGSGVGKNSEYAASLGASVVGIDIARNAVEEARRRSEAASLMIRYDEGNLGAPLAFDTASFEIILDVMSSNSLSESERATYVTESARVLSPGGFMLVRGLAREGDKNASRLLKEFPGAEPGTYVLPGLGITERVFTETELQALYGEHFALLSYKRTAHYTRVSGRIFRRSYFTLYLQKPASSKPDGVL